MADNAIDCVVISSDPQLVGRAVRLMSDEQKGLNMVGEYSQPIAEIGKPMAEEIRRLDAKLVLLDLGDDPAVGLRLAKYLAEDSRGRVFVLTGPTVAPEVLLEAMRVGASEYLPKPIEEAELAAALTRAARRLAGPEARGEGPQQGRITEVLGAKGGVGVSTVAANLAVALAKSGRSTILLDFDLDMGSSAVILGLRPRYSVLDVVKNLHRLDRDLLGSLAETHDSGLTVLASPGQPGPGEKITREQARSMLAFVRRHFEQVVVDLDRAISPVTIGALEAADDVLLVTTPDVASLNNTKRALPVIERATGDTKRVRVIVNRRRSSDVITIADVSKALGKDVLATLPNEEAALTDSLNTGKPEVLRNRSKYGRELESMARSLTSAYSSNGRNGKGSGVMGIFRRSRK
ncbi:MAG TPA: P-loop NTPase [Longimicrobiales bacterium]|nr:P-loop NTPase [Longimicrobiales bacterium]